MAFDIDRPCRDWKNTDGLEPGDRWACRLVGIFGSVILALALVGITGSAAVKAEDRLLGMVEPVKAKKPYPLPRLPQI